MGESASSFNYGFIPFIDGYALPEAHVRRITELNMSGLAMTEHGSIDSHSALERAAVKAGIKPLFGVEGYFPAEPKLAGEVQSKFHLTIIARNAEGYRNLVQLVTKSWQNFYYEPTMTWEMLKQHKRGLLILSGCLGSYLACATVGGKTIPPEQASFKRGLGIARAFKREFGQWYHIEVQAFPELDKTRQFNPLAARIAKTIGAKLVGTMDCHYTILEEAEVQQILHGLRPGNKQSLEERARTWGYDVPLCPPPSDMAIYRRLRATGLTKGQAIEAVASTAELAAECVVELPKMPGVEYPGLSTDFDSWGDHDVHIGHLLPEAHEARAGVDMMAVWNHWLREGWRFRGLDKLPPTERRKYRKQLVYEKDLIESKDFVSYFLLVSAGVRHIKDLGHPVGPGRGSAAASLIAWVLRITEVNPLRPEFNGMIRFERFIDETRTDLPDIDLDFPSSTRPALRDFYVRLLGEGCVNNVGTYTYFRSKNSLDDVARVYHIPKFEVDTVKGYLIERTNIDLRASNTIADTVAQFPVAAEVFGRHPELHKAELLEGGIRGFGIHAAAIILSNGPISEITSVAEREVPKGSGNIVQAIGLDKKDAEYRGLLKMDFLGLNTMQMLDDCIHHPEVAMTLNELYALPLDDPRIYEAFRDNDVVGIFQMNGRATRYVNGAVQPTEFHHLMDITSLSRPGALHGGGTQEYIDIKNGVKEHEPLHPAIEELTALTQYQIIFQEQILTILREIGGFPWGAVNAIRTIISRKHGEAAFNAKRQEFLDGAAKLHIRRPELPPMTEMIADTLWRRMITSGQYSFNVAHAASYSLISYYCQHMKVYHPHVFYYASLKNMGDDETTNLIRDAHQHKIDVHPPSLRRSGTSWEAVGGSVRAGFEQIPGIGPKMAPAIVQARRRARPPWRRWGDLISVKGIGVKGIENIKAWTAKDDPWDVYLWERRIESVKKCIISGELGPLPEPTHSSVDIPEDKGVNIPVVWLGQVTERNWRDMFEYHLSKFGTDLDPESIKDPELREWVVAFGEDSSERVLLKIDRWKYPRLKGAISAMDIKKELILVEGVKSKYSSARQINVRNCWIIDPE